MVQMYKDINLIRFKTGSFTQILDHCELLLMKKFHEISGVAPQFMQQLLEQQQLQQQLQKQQQQQQQQRQQILGLRKSGTCDERLSQLIGDIFMGNEVRIFTYFWPADDVI